MALVDLWMESRDQILGKQVQQIIVFAGEGRLLDGSQASAEFRAFLSRVPTKLLQEYAGECLTDSFSESGLALQDIVNEVGSRLDLHVTFGRYRGTTRQIGWDGLWRFPSDHAAVVEVKTTDAYRIRLDRILEYRAALVQEGTITAGASSALIVVGRQDTGDLEAQIRGSRFAWDVRLISVDSLVRLVAIKESIEDPIILRRIHDILVPREYTRLDDIVDILFSTAEDIKQEEPPLDDDLPPGDNEAAPRSAPVAFHDECVERVSKHMGLTLLKSSRSRFRSDDGTVTLTCSVSREHQQAAQRVYWFAFHTHQREYLGEASQPYVVFGCVSADDTLLIPFADFDPWLAGMSTTTRDGGTYWHVKIVRRREDNGLILTRRRGQPEIDLAPYLLPPDD